jgi:hypothetical protein
MGHDMDTFAAIVGNLDANSLTKRMSSYWIVGPSSSLPSATRALVAAGCYEPPQYRAKTTMDVAAMPHDQPYCCGYRPLVTSRIPDNLQDSFQLMLGRWHSCSSNVESAPYLISLRFAVTNDRCCSTVYARLLSSRSKRSRIRRQLLVYSSCMQ